MGCGGSKTASEPRPRPSPNRQVESRNTLDKNANSSKNNYNQQANGVKKEVATHTQTESRYYTESQNGDLDKEPTDKGYKRRLRMQLKEATNKNDLEALEKARDKFVKNKLEDCGDLTRADDKIEYLRLKRDLREAIRRRHEGVLEKTIEEAECSKFSSQLEPQIEAARRELEHLREMDRYNHDILNMDQQTISEIRSYHRPLACVHDVMAATYMLLGYEESELRDWAYVQSMIGRVGRDSLIHQVKDFDSNTVSDKTSKRVRQILTYHDLDEVRAASNGAATFYVWEQDIVDKVDRDKADREEQMNEQDETLSRIEENQNISYIG